MKRIWIFVGIILGTGLALTALLLTKPIEEIQANNFVVPLITGDFSKATSPRDFEFPLDHGAHNEFQTEWWYYTGNLAAQDGMEFGYELTFFRRALLPANESVERASDWAADQIYLAHFTITDVSSQKFHFQERMARGAVDLAGATGTPLFKVWLYDWQVTQREGDLFELVASNDKISLSLLLEDKKGPILQGDHGLSQKGDRPGNASYYYSQTRLLTRGTLLMDGENIPVSGLSWMDHEFSTSALAEGQIGWDWFSIQLDNHREIMVYTIRRTDGSIDSFSNGTIVETDGSTRRLNADDFNIEITSYWDSPQSGAQYPASWILKIPAEQVILEISPVIPNQELLVSFIYWEGAVEITGVWAGEAVSGRGYVELTGYAESMAGQF
jgi:predicted secreted hydrolase